MHHIFLFVGSLLPLVAGSFYIHSIFRGTTKPHRTTYALLSVITGLSFAALYGGGDTSGVWLAGVAFIQCLVLFVISLRFGMGGKDPFDVLCMSLCLLGVAAWLLTGESLLGLLASIVADMIAVLPTMRKMWRYPFTEVPLFYGIDTLASAVIIMAGPYGWRSLLYPGYLLLINACCWWIVVMRRRLHSMP